MLTIVRNLYFAKIILSNLSKDKQLSAKEKKKIYLAKSFVQFRLIIMPSSRISTTHFRKGATRQWSAMKQTRSTQICLNPEWKTH